MGLPLPHFDCAIDFDPGGKFDEFLQQAPAKWVVYLLADADDRPVQLLCVKNLRYSLERRLGPGGAEERRSKRVDYREFVRRVYWRRVDSAFEADFVYWDAVRTLFPKTYRGMMAYRPAWFVHIDPMAKFPRFVRTTDLSTRAGTCIGPVDDKHVAQKLVERVEDAFDLCRYYNVLTESPNGKACAYKEMGRCPAPCDGTVSMDHYRAQVAGGLNALVDPKEMVRRLTADMHEAASQLKFEEAKRIKVRIDQVSKFSGGPYRHVRRLEEFEYLSVQRGPRGGTAKVFLVTPEGMEEIAGLIAEPKSMSDWLGYILQLAAKRRRRGPGDPILAAERMGLTAHHLFLPKQAQGVFLRVGEITESSLEQAYRDLRKQKEPENVENGEGVVREAVPIGEFSGEK